MSAVLFSALFNGIRDWWKDIFFMGGVHDGKTSTQLFSLKAHYEISQIFIFLCAHITCLYSQMHADDFRNDLYGLVSGLKNGGYSDDMTLAAVAGKTSMLPCLKLGCEMRAFMLTCDEIFPLHVILWVVKRVYNRMQKTGVFFIFSVKI